MILAIKHDRRDPDYGVIEWTVDGFCREGVSQKGWVAEHRLHLHSSVPVREKCLRKMLAKVQRPQNESRKRS
jgi:hypothetical protein